MIAYLFPLLGMLLGAALFASFAAGGSSVSSYDFAAVLGAALGLVFGSMLARIASTRFLGAQNLPRFIRAVAQSELR